MPTTTPIPDEIFDELMADLTGAELKVLLYICRRTFGFKKESDSISLNQISSGIVTRDGRVLDNGTGLSKRHVQRALKVLEEKNIVRVTRKLDESGANEINVYSLNFIDRLGTKSPYGRDILNIGVETPVSTTTNRTQQTVNNNVKRQREKKKNKQRAMSEDEVAYYAQQIAEKLGDTKSISFYKQAVLRHNPHTLLQKAHEIVADGGAKNPGAVFVDWLKKQSGKQQ